jgi:hypothetical protein
MMCFSVVQAAFEGRHLIKVFEATRIRFSIFPAAVDGTTGKAGKERYGRVIRTVRTSP